MSDQIKSIDLCERCEFSFVRRCISDYDDCSGCEMNGGESCKCLTIEPNTPCPYFKEADDEIR